MCKMLLGDEHDPINAFLDAPVRDVGPRIHRQVFHDEETIRRITLFNAEAGMATMLHKILDENTELQKVLGVMAVMDAIGKR